MRELENVIERAVVLSSGPDIGPDLLPDPIVGRGTPVPLLEHRGDASLFDIVEDCERRIILDMLEKCNWNQTEAAERFHVPLSTLNQKIKRLNIEIKKKVGSRERTSASDLGLRISPLRQCCRLYRWVFNCQLQSSVLGLSRQSRVQSGSLR